MVAEFSLLSLSLPHPVSQTVNSPLGTNVLNSQNVTKLYCPSKTELLKKISDHWLLIFLSLEIESALTVATLGSAITSFYSKQDDSHTTEET